MHFDHLSFEKFYFQQLP